MLKKRHQTTIVFLFLLLVVSGCLSSNTSYNHKRLKDLPKDELAILWVLQQYKLTRDSITAVYIDGATTPIEPYGFWDWLKIYVLPGNHKIKFTCRRKPYYQSTYEIGTGTVSFEARAGVWYHLDPSTGINEATEEDLKKVFWGKSPFLSTSKSLVTWKELSEDGVFPLHVASELGNADEVKKLLDTGADVNEATDEDGSTPLHIAIEEGNTEVVKLLLDAGADVNIPKNDGVTALFSASGKGHTEVVKLLLDAGSDVNKAKHNGVTALYIASGKGHIEVVKVLLVAGADVNIASQNG
ncbi:MAG: ankyrin repeat domain-containing protein, partial [Deltaproteobacteria bacterium]|nr:ankyrin repeat domain-containing protein [Deltaproteobacteria bacterium]